MSRDDGMAFRFWVRCSRLRPNSHAEVVVAIALAGLGLVGCSRSGSPAATEPPAPAAKTDVVEFDREGLDLAGIQVTAAESSAVDDGLELNGSLEADSSATAIVTPRTEGKIVRLFPGVGDSVGAGELIAVVESARWL